MIVAAHQPAYLPWIGYLAKIAACDQFVLMDDLQYEAQNFQNRNRVKLNHGAAWLTVPLERGPQTQRICDKRICNGGSPKEHWARRHLETLRVHYRTAPYWSRYAPALEALYAQPWESLLALDLEILRLFLSWLEIDTPLSLASALRLEGQKSDRILDMCRKSGASTYLSGRGASTGYLDVGLFERASISVAWQRFTHPIYPQRYPRLGFISHLSALDLVLNCGPDAAQMVRASLAEEQAA